MEPPATPNDEPERQATVDSLNIVYSPPEERFERITRIAKRLFDVPIALISIVSDDIQWFKSRQGLTAPETSREVSFCGHAILRDDTFVVPNAAHDPDFMDNPLVTGPPNIRFYAGRPISFDGAHIGTLCLIDTKPRQFKPKDYDSLKCLAHWVESELQQVPPTELVHKRLKLRKELLEPVTGDFNCDGLDAIQRMLLEDNPQQESVTLLLIEIEPKAHQQLSPDAVKALSSAVHVVVNDTGTVGYDPEFGFKVLLTHNSESRASEFEATLSAALLETNLVKSSEISVSTTVAD